MGGARGSRTPPLGIVADDITGACDVAEALHETGLRTIVLLGVPTAIPQADAAVVALKVRTAPVTEAVEQSVASAERLVAAGYARLYQKYCSTFDSTARGNIGPIADGLAALLGSRGSVGTPATPARGRTVVDGRLFVGNVPLERSSMRDHPLTPMRDGDLVRLLTPQTPTPVARLAASRPATGAHLLADARSDADLDALAASLEPGRFLLGGAAGLAAALGRRASAGAVPPPAPRVPVRGRLVIAGSASAATRAQVAGAGGPTVTVDPLVLAEDGTEPILAATLAALRSTTAPVVVAARTSPGAIQAAQEALGPAAAAELVEDALAAATVAAVGSGLASHIVVAGGETSGAVTAALGVRVLTVGRAAAPGVPWTTGITADGELIALLLKSGNFGATDLFETAWESAP